LYQNIFYIKVYYIYIKIYGKIILGWQISSFGFYFDTDSFRFIFFCSRRHCVILLCIWKVTLNVTFLWILVWITLVLCMLR